MPGPRTASLLFVGAMSACLAAGTLAQRLDVGNGFTATFAPPPGWDSYMNPAWDALHDGSCWRTSVNGSTLCARTIEIRGRQADWILSDELAEWFGEECTEEKTTPEDFPGGRAVHKVCVYQDLFGPTRRTWLSLIVQGPTQAVFLEATESNHDESVQEAIRQSMASVRFEGGAPDPRDAMQSLSLGNGYRIWYDPPAGWSSWGRENQCFSSPNQLGTICLVSRGLLDRTLERAFEDYMGDAECMQREDDGGPTDFGRMLIRRCIVQIGPRTERHVSLAALADGARNVAFVTTSEVAYDASVRSAMERTVAGIRIGQQ